MAALILMIIALILMVLAVVLEPTAKLRDVALCFMLGSFVAQLWRF